MAIVYEKRNDRAVYLAFALMGALFAFIPAAITGPSRAAGLEVDLASWLIMPIPFGALIGLFFAPMGVVCLRRKSLSRAVTILLLTTIPATALGAMTFPSGLLSLLPLGAFATTLVVMRFWLPDLPQPPHCSECSYDLTGNVSGVCPECGTAIDEPGDER